MTYEKLFYLKFKKGYSTYELAKLYPNQIGQVSEVALLDIPEETLKAVIKEAESLRRVMRLKRKFSRLL